jgi:hypothetical protein
MAPAGSRAASTGQRADGVDSSARQAFSRPFWLVKLRCCLPQKLSVVDCLTF